jgi:large subunit ribosomal protein L36e
MVKGKANSGIVVGLNKGFNVTKRPSKTSPARQSKKLRVVREIIQDVVGYMPYEKRVMEMLSLVVVKVFL